nr:MAG TPA: hypothetical protein [Caudoviricetes sp.]
MLHTCLYTSFFVGLQKTCFHRQIYHGCIETTYYVILTNFKERM